MSYVFSFTFFSRPLVFTLHWWSIAFLILSLPLQNFHVVLPTKKCLLCFLSLALDLRRPFSHWASLACRLLPLFLCLSVALYSKFANLTITVHNTDTETISAFRFRLYWLFSCPCFTRRRWLCDFPPKYPRVVFGLPYLLIELFYIGMTVLRTDGPAVGVRSRDFQIFSDG